MGMWRIQVFPPSLLSSTPASPLPSQPEWKVRSTCLKSVDRVNVVNVVHPAPNRVVGLGGKSRRLRPGGATIVGNPESERIAAHAADHIELHGVGGIDLHVARAVVGGTYHATELNPARTAVGAAPHALDVGREIEHVRVARTDLNIHATEGRSGRSGAIDARRRDVDPLAGGQRGWCAGWHRDACVRGASGREDSGVRGRVTSATSDARPAFSGAPAGADAACTRFASDLPDQRLSLP